MKVLTIREPWASLIIYGYKKYEFRSWKTNYRGKILIHAGLGIDKNVLNKFIDYNIDYSKGAIIGEADLIDCILIDNDFTDGLRRIDPLIYENSGYNEIYAWKLDNVKKYDKPITVKGKLGLWNYDMDGDYDET